MKFSCVLMSLVVALLLLLMGELNADNCVKPSPTVTTTVAPPVSKTTCTPKPTAPTQPTPPHNGTTSSDETDETDESDETDETSTSGAPGTSTDSPSSEDPGSSTSTRLPKTTTPSTASSATPGASTEPPPGPTPTTTTTTQSGTTRTTVAVGTTTEADDTVDANAMCHNHPGVQFLPHPYNCHKYIQCSNGYGHVMSCSANLYWDSRLNTCADQCA